MEKGVLSSPHYNQMENVVLLLIQKVYCIEHILSLAILLDLYINEAIGITGLCIPVSLYM